MKSGPSKQESYTPELGVRGSSTFTVSSTLRISIGPCKITLPPVELSHTRSMPLGNVL